MLQLRAASLKAWRLHLHSYGLEGWVLSGRTGGVEHEPKAEGRARRDFEHCKRERQCRTASPVSVVQAPATNNKHQAPSPDPAHSW